MPWATGAALREVYASSGLASASNKKGSDEGEEEEEGLGSSSSSGSGSGNDKEGEEGMEGVHARCLTPVMLAGGDALVAALGALEAAAKGGGG